jgi:NAD(P)-dependent dehydrogenase (short-subunit alcohol dehydrogenase family)
VAAVERAVAELNAGYPAGKAVSLPGDLSTLQGVEQVVASLRGHTDALDVLVANAGATWGAPYEDYPDAAWAKVMDLNVRHVFNLTQRLTPLLARAARPGDPSRVVTIASVDGVRATQTAGPTAAFAYTVSKGAVVHLTKALCRALSGQNITVNCIAPGVFPSQMTKFVADSGLWQAQERANPLGRLGQTSDVAGLTLFLVSKAGSWCNGQIIALDGGQILHDAGLGFSKA